MSRARIALVAVACSLASAGCWEQVSKKWFAQMKEQPSVQALEGVEPLMPPEGTIPAGGITARIGTDNPMFGNPMLSPEARDIPNPIASTPESLARGKYLYGVYCELCHGADGMASYASLPVAQRLAQSGAPPFPLAATPNYTDGMIYTKIRYGKPLMPGYERISSEDRWHVVNYLRTLIKGN